MKMFIVAVLLLFCSSPALAQERPDGAEIPPAAGTRIEVDEEAGTLTIVVKGRPVALFDERGLHVRGDVAYGGVLADEGQRAFEDRVKEGDAP